MDSERVTDHLQPTTTDRGFKHMPPIPSKYGGDVKVYESSAAIGPHLWLRAESPVDMNKPDGPTVEAVIHLRADDAWHLSEQLQWLLEHHYQGDARPQEMTGLRIDRAEETTDD